MEHKTHLRSPRTPTSGGQAANRFASGRTYSKLNSSLSPICISYFHSSLLSPISTRVLSYIHLCSLTRLLNAAFSSAFLLFHSNAILPATLSFPSLLLRFVHSVTKSSIAASFCIVSIASIAVLQASSFLKRICAMLTASLVVFIPFASKMNISNPSLSRMAKSITKYLLWRPVESTIHLKMSAFLKSFESNLIKKPENREKKVPSSSTSAFLPSAVRARSFLLSFLLLFILIRKCK